MSKKTHLNNYNILNFKEKHEKITTGISASVYCLHKPFRECFSIFPFDAQSEDFNVAKLAEQAPVHWVSVAQIENSLTGRRRWRSAFDIDDTVLTPAPDSGAEENLLPDGDDYHKKR